MTLHDLAASLAALGCVLALVWLVLRGLRRAGLGDGGAPGRLRVVARLAVDPKRRLLLVAVDGREMLLLTGGPNDLLIEAARPDMERAA